MPLDDYRQAPRHRHATRFDFDWRWSSRRCASTAYEMPAVYADGRAISRLSRAGPARLTSADTRPFSSLDIA